MVRSAGVLGHTGISGPAPFIATGLFLTAIGASYGAHRLFTHPSDPLRRATSIGLGVVRWCFERFGLRAEAMPG